jgi:hypothetical protein
MRERAHDASEREDRQTDRQTDRDLVRRGTHVHQSVARECSIYKHTDCLAAPAYPPSCQHSHPLLPLPTVFPVPRCSCEHVRHTHGGQHLCWVSQIQGGSLGSSFMGQQVTN